MNEFLPHMNEKPSNEVEYTLEEFDIIKKDVIKDMTDFITGAEYKERLITEYKIAKLPYDNFTLEDFNEAIKSIKLETNELNSIDLEIQKRKKIIDEISGKIHLYTVAFEDHISNILDVDGFYVPSTSTSKKYYKRKNENTAKICEKNNIYIKNQIKSANDIELKTTIFHELSHAIVDGNSMNYGASRLLLKHDYKYYKGSEKYLGNKAEQFARLGEVRYFLKLYNITNSINEKITKQHINMFLQLPISDKNTQQFLMHMKFLIEGYYGGDNDYSDYLNLINSIASSSVNNNNDTGRTS